jgi:hypothetical protein
MTSSTRMDIRAGEGRAIRPVPASLTEESLFGLFGAEEAAEDTGEEPAEGAVFVGALSAAGAVCALTCFAAVAVSVEAASVLSVGAARALSWVWGGSGGICVSGAFSPRAIPSVCPASSFSVPGRARS